MKKLGTHIVSPHKSPLFTFDIFFLWDQPRVCIWSIQLWSIHLPCMIATVCSALLNELHSAKHAEGCWSEGQQSLCYWNLSVAGMTSTPSLFRAVCSRLCLVPGSNGKSKGTRSCSRSSALMTLALRQADRVHPIRPASQRRLAAIHRASAGSLRRAPI